jgi:subtilisin-like proprotein convertase family protein
VAGVVAMMLDVNPTLTWRDVQDILVRSATKNDPTSPGWRLNGAGRPIHDRYGFGRVDAATAVAMAASWSAVTPDALPMVQFAGPVMAQVTPIPDNNATGVSFQQPVTTRFTAQHVELDISIQHGRRGDIELVLISPSGTVSTLATPRPNDSAVNLNWTFTSVQFWGEPTAGVWRLVARDRRSGLTGRVLNWSLRIHGRHLNLPRGDMNADGVFNAYDIDPFVLAIAAPSIYVGLFPGIDANYVGDFDGNGVLTINDLSGFAVSMSR